MNYGSKLKTVIYFSFIGLQGWADVINAAVNQILDENNIAVIVNLNDSQSIEVAEYYQSVRNIPDANMIQVRFSTGQSVISAEEFNKVYSEVKSKLSKDVQAYALTWTQPYKVDCMSITSAFALGFEKDYCADGCKPTRQQAYYNSQSSRPYNDFDVRPAMMLAGKNVGSVKKLIDRGVRSDFTRPRASAYLLNTSDKQRTVRSIIYPAIENTFNQTADIHVLDSDHIKGKNEVMFYFTGTTQVEYLDTMHFASGAIADHLTSAGGVLTGSSQMSVLEWLESGVTGSYGAVVEPCNYLEKFPNPGIVMQNYLNGDTLLEAYWKSVAMPGQGVFVGEPLASPYKGCRLTMNQNGKFSFKSKITNNYVERSNTNCH